MGELSFFVCAESSASGEVLRERLQGCGHARVEAVLIDPGVIGAELEARRVDALLVELAPDPQAVFEALAKLPPPRPLLLVSGPQKDSELVLRPPAGT